MIAKRFDDGIEEITPRQWHAREADMHRNLVARFGHLFRGRVTGPARRRVVDLVTGKVHDDAWAAADWLGEGARPNGVGSCIAQGISYYGRWFAWDAPELRTPAGRAAELRQRRPKRAKARRRIPHPRGGCAVLNPPAAGADGGAA